MSEFINEVIKIILVMVIKYKEDLDEWSDVL